MKIWELISNEINEKGYALTPMCDEKWKRLLTQYRKHYDSTKKSGNNAIKWQYFKLMGDAIAPSKKQAISPPKALLYESSDHSGNEPCNSHSLTNKLPTSSTSPSASPSLSKVLPKELFPTPPSTSKQFSTEPSLLQSSTILKSKIPVWYQQYETMKKEQTFIQNNELNKRLDKLESRVQEMLKVQKELVAKLNTVNEIENQKLELFKKIFNVD